jgi:hypothetical protein
MPSASGQAFGQEHPRVHVKFVVEVDAIVLPIISMDNGWSPFVTSTEAVWPSGEVCLLRKESRGQSRFLHSVRCAHYGRNDRRFFL